MLWWTFFRGCRLLAAAFPFVSFPFFVFFVFCRSFLCARITLDKAVRIVRVSDLCPVGEGTNEQAAAARIACASEEAPLLVGGM